MHTHIRKFVRRLRARGIDISTGEHLDALAALQHVPWLDRSAFREALRTTLVKRADLTPVFDEEFSRYFAPPPLPKEDKNRRGPGRGGQMSRAERNQSGATGEEGGRGEPGERPPKEQSTTRGEDRGKPDEAGTGQEREGEQSRPEAAAAGQKEGRQGLGLQEEGTAGRTPHFTTPAPREAQRTVRELLRSSPRRMSPAELRELRRHVGLMARRLATQAARRRRSAHRGSIEMKTTVRRSLQFGGVPFLLSHRRHKIRDPELLVLCDVSGSVVKMAELTLELLRGLAATARKLRVFGYTNRAREVTSALLAGETNLPRAAEDAGLDLHAFSDFGGACYQLLQDEPRLVGRRTSVIVIGDGRNNHSEAMQWAFEDLVRGAHRVVWLVPEARERWNTADSQLRCYEPMCHLMAECDTVEKLLKALRRAW